MSSQTVAQPIGRPGLWRRPARGARRPTNYVGEYVKSFVEKWDELDRLGRSGQERGAVLHRCAACPWQGDRA